MLEPHDFFKSDSPHGLGKRLILKKYLQAYIPIMLSEFNHLTIFDGFAGRGLYIDQSDTWPSEIEKYGSPLIALHVAIQHFWKITQFTPKQPKSENIPEWAAEVEISLARDIECEQEKQERLTLVFVEKDKENYRMLCLNVIHIMSLYDLDYKVEQNVAMGYCKVFEVKDYIVCKIYCAKFSQMKAPPEPSFAVLDPFGYSQTPMDKVKTFLGHSKEVFFTLMSSSVNRFLKTSNASSIAALLGLSDAELGNFVHLHDTAEDKIEDVANCYEKQLMRLTSAEFIVHFVMQNKQNVKLYHLVFATNHPKGIEKMKEAMNRATQEPKELQLSDFKILRMGKILNFANNQDDNMVANAIFEQFSGQQNVRITKVKNFILFDTLYVYRKKPLAILEKEGKMKVVNEDERQRKYTFPDGKIWVLEFKEAA